MALSCTPTAQVIITTHSATIVKGLQFENIRLVRMENSEKIVESILPNQLPYPSLNEVNYLAFTEVSEEYHNELYGYIEEQDLLGDYKQGKPLVSYTRILRNGTTRSEQLTMTEYIRNQIHHPENTLNTRYSAEDLLASINQMRQFIQAQH